MYIYMIDKGVFRPFFTPIYNFFNGILFAFKDSFDTAIQAIPYPSFYTQSDSLVSRGSTKENALNPAVDINMCPRCRHMLILQKLLRPVNVFAISRRR